MGNPNCDRCGEKVTQEEPLIQVVVYLRYEHEFDEGGMEHVAYYHTHCWEELKSSV
jgi:hypothetical protein